jgi:protein involved in polysaccharide export with SLBB domain
MRAMGYGFRAVVMGALLGLSWHVHAQVQTQTPPVLPTAAQQGASTISLVDYKIGPRDTLNIQVFKEDLFPPQNYPVLLDGTIFFYNTDSLRAIPVAGLTAQLVQERIKAALIKDGLFTAPSVIVQVVAYHSQQVTITGAVVKFGVFTLTADQMTLMEALFNAGGLTTEAGPEVQVRRNKKLGEKGTLNPDDPNTIGQTIETMTYNFEDMNTGKIDGPVLQDGDYIYVPKAEKVTVSGEVANPGAVTLLPGMTVIEAIRKAGGAKTQTAAMNRLSIKRYDSAKGKYVEVPNVKETTLVQANDVITVPKKRIG